MPVPRFISRVTKASFFLIHECPQDFVVTRWCENPFVYAIWSTVCSIYVVSMVFYTAVATRHGFKILIWLTYWVFYSLTLRFVVTACNSWLYIRRQKKNCNTNPNFYSLQSYTTGNIFQEHEDDQIVAVGTKTYSDGNSNACLKNSDVAEVKKCGLCENEHNESCKTKIVGTKCEVSASGNSKGQNEKCENNLPVMITFQWFLQSISNAPSLIVTVLFWGLIYSGEVQDYSSINSHVINSLLVTGDIMVSRAPIRIQHFHMPLTYLSIYIVFTLIYWAGGGTNHVEQKFIYSILDYSTRPGSAAIAITLTALFGVLLSQTYLYFLYRLRNCLFIWKREGVLFYA